MHTQRIYQKLAKKRLLQVVPGLEPGIREIYDFDVSKSHVLTATLSVIDISDCLELRNMFGTYTT